MTVTVVSLLVVILNIQMTCMTIKKTFRRPQQKMCLTNLVEWKSIQNFACRQPIGEFQSEKLLQALYNKEWYTLHYITLKLYVSLGLKVKKLHRCLNFNQSKWFSPYIDLYTDMRQRVANKFEENFFKLMSNWACGRCCESKWNHQ